MDTADTPISFFAEHSGTHYETLAYELSRARLRLFVLGEVLDETRCLAEDLMTGDHFYVNMTPEWQVIMTWGTSFWAISSRTKVCA